MKLAFDELLYQELIAIAASATPALVPILEHARKHGMIVKRYQSGQKIGMLYISMVEKTGGDYSQWSQLNCGPGLEMYQLVQTISKMHWESTHSPGGESSHP